MSTTKSILENYIIVYEITSLPTILYAETTKASEPIHFKQNVTIPSELSTAPIECRYSIYNKEGSLIELCSEMLPGIGVAIRNSINVTPMRMINKLLEDILKHINHKD